MGFTHFSVVDAELDEVFAWHARPGAITRLSPPWQPVRVLAEASSLRDGQAVLGLPGGLRWVATHQPDRYDPPHAFADVLESFPLSAIFSWRHTHRFAAADGSRTLVTDEVETSIPERALRSMFNYRHRQLADDLAAQARARVIDPATLTVAVTGSSGLIGTALTALLTTSGHRVIRLVRHRPTHPAERFWQPDDPAADLLTGVDAVVHLAGASIGGRFTPDHKREIRDSRIDPTRRLAELAAAAAPGGTLRAFVAASAIGIYGPDRGEEILTEASVRGDGFLADVVADWEDATAPAAAAGLRTVQVRTGIVQTPRGGMLRLLGPLFAAGLWPARHRQAVAGLDRHRRSGSTSTCGPCSTPVCPARSTRSPRSRYGTSITPGRWPACCTARRCCRCPALARACCSARRVPGKSPRPASTSGQIS